MFLTYADLALCLPHKDAMAEIAFRAYYLNNSISAFAPFQIFGSLIVVEV